MIKAVGDVEATTRGAEDAAPRRMRGARRPLLPLLPLLILTLSLTTPARAVAGRVPDGRVPDGRVPDGRSCPGASDPALLCADDSIVHIRVALSPTERSDGSGMVLASDASGAYIMTAAHVVQGGLMRHMSVSLDDGRAFPVLGLAAVRGDAPARDVAVLRIAPVSIPSVALSSRRPTVGAPVLAAGYVGDSGGDMTGADGRVLGLGVNVGDGAGPIYLAHDAPIAPGDSGGPVYDRASGRVIGMDVAILTTRQGHTQTSISLALPLSAIGSLARALAARVRPRRAHA